MWHTSLLIRVSPDLAHFSGLWAPCSIRASWLDGTVIGTCAAAAAKSLDCLVGCLVIREGLPLEPGVKDWGLWQQGVELNSVKKRLAISALSIDRRDTTTGCLKRPVLRWFAVSLCRPRAKMSHSYRKDTVTVGQIIFIWNLFVMCLWNNYVLIVWMYLSILITVFSYLITIIISYL